MQLKYGDMEPGMIGQIADETCKTIETFAAEEALDPGIPVVRGTTADKQVKAATTGTTAKVIGIVAHRHKEPADPYYPVGSVIGVMTKGRMYVPATKAVVAGKTANYKIAEKGFTDEAVTEGIEKIGVPCKFVTSTAAKGIAVIEIGATLEE